MRREDFSPGAPGALIAIPGGVAFLPNPLPPPLAPSPRLMRATEEARGAIGELTGQARLIENTDPIIRALARREAVLSSRTEGINTEMRELLSQEADPESRTDEDSDVFEVLNYLGTIDLATAWFADGRPLDLALIRELHARLLQGVRGQHKSPGATRKKDVYIGNRRRGFEDARFVPPPHEQVEPLFATFGISLARPSDFGPLIDAGLAHYQFETIHPFEDGNGRLGRLLVPLQLIERGVLDRPLIYLGPFIDANADEYKDRLLAVSTNGDWEGWLVFFLNAVRSTAIDARLRVERIMQLRGSYEETVRSASSTRAPLLAINLVMNRIYVTVAQVADYTQTSYPTARAAIDVLAKLGIIVPDGRFHGSHRWRAEEVIRKVYES